MSKPSKIKSKPYRNWVRGALGLFYLQKGLYPFTDRVVKAEHAKVVQNLTPCTGCAIENILPDHASSKVCIQKNKAKCNCRKKTNTNCATCSKIYDEIILQHRFNDPHWVTDCSKWYNDHWQFAKCFLTTTSKGSNNTAAETDASGLLSIIINGLFCQSEILCNIDPPNDSYSQVREIRNEILHNSTLDLTDQDMARYLQSMIAVLEDKKTLSLDQAAQAAAAKLKELLNDELVIRMNEEAKAIQSTLDAIKVAKEQSEESIRKLAEEKQNALMASEENIKKITEDSRAALEQQTSESATEIKTAKEQAIANVTSTVSTVFKEFYESEISQLKQGHDDHENRLRAVEAEQQNLQLKQKELENQVAELKQQVDKLTDIEKKHQTRIEHLKQKQDLQQYMVDDYQQHHVKTWISPLMTQHNDVNIRDVYVSPRMEVEVNKDVKGGNTTKVGKDKETKKKHIERYCDLFSTEEKQNRRIFILGDVGTGKSTFCKMMMQNWCTAITKRGYSDDSCMMEEEGENEGKERNTCDLNQFDFLFYIPLREMSGYINDIVDMIKAQLEDYKVLIDDIFSNDSERILILADGLDEWTPRTLNRPPSLHHVRIGIPTSRLARASTIVTTSRPSSRGILNMQSSECDLKVYLLGLNESSVQHMIKKYMKLLNKSSALPNFKEKLSSLELKYIQNAPMLLQQIIWLYCNDYDIGQSRSSIYVHILNSVLGWEDEKMGSDPKWHEFHNSDLEHLPLPKSFDEFARCQENRKLFSLLGRLAYDAYITGDGSSLVFGRYKLKQLGLSDGDISAILRTGILTEINSPDPTYEKSRFSFIHTSYLEFFAAVYICSCYLSKITDVDSSSTFNILESLIAVTPKTSVTEILRLENVLTMVCGLVPCLTEYVCECIYKITLGKNIDYFLAAKIQKFICNCLTEHNSVDQETMVKFKQRHVSMLYRVDEAWLDKYLYGIDPTGIETCSINCMLSHEQSTLLSSCLSQAVSLHTLTIQHIECTKDECDGHIIDLSNHRKLQNLELSRFKDLFSSKRSNKISVSGINRTFLESCRISRCNLSHEQYMLLSTFLSQALSLRTLKIERIKCTKVDCEGHIIDLTNHTKLQSIELSKSKISVSGINHSYLESCRIADCVISHETLSALSSCLSLQELKIKCIECAKDECEGHIIDLSNNRELQSIKLIETKIPVSSINTTCLESFEISYCKLSHEQCTLISSYLSQALSLQTLKIDTVECTKVECEGHIIDFTNHRNLQSIRLSGRKISIFGKNLTYPESCVISYCELSHEQCSLLSFCLSQAISLQTLQLNRIECAKDVCEGHIIDLTNNRTLQRISLSDSKISVSGTNHTCLESCFISNCKLSHEQCISLSSYISQATSLQSLLLSRLKYVKPECEGHRIACHDVDLTNHNHLERLSISKCNMISITGINPTCPILQCDISNCYLSHEQCTSLCTSLSNAKYLNKLTLSEIKCTKDTCEGHEIDITNHKQLKELSVYTCNMIPVTGINPTCPIWKCTIGNCNLSHKQCTSLCTFLSHAEVLNNLKLSEIKCTEDACAGHEIDITNHKQLKELSLSNCSYTISITGMNPACSILGCTISNCYLSHEQCTSLCTSLSNAKYLNKLTLRAIKCTKYACEDHKIDINNHKQLKELSVYNCNVIPVTGINPTCPILSCSIRNCNLSHKQCTSLCTFLSHAESLKYLRLSEIKCTKDACAGHEIDITNHKQLKELSLSNCSYTISITGMNPACSILGCTISNCYLSHEQCTSLCTFLSHTKCLNDLELIEIKCTKYACEDHEIDINNHKQLKELYVDNCNMIPVTGINPTCPILSCSIRNCNLSHKQCTSLCTFLSHAESLKYLTLSEIKCTKDACAGHEIDITNHKQLKELSLSNCSFTISITGMNPACSILGCTISNCYLSHEQCTSLCTCLSNAKYLNKLTLRAIKCTKYACEDHEIDITNHKQLKELSVDSCNMIPVTGINPTCPILSCSIRNCNLSHKHCTSLCTFLSHAECLNDLTLSEIKCTKDACAGHEIDITNHKQLKELSLSNCSYTASVTGRSPACSILRCTFSNCNLTHEQCTSLCTFLSHAKSLNCLTLSEIKCTKDACAGHYIDLTNHKQFQDFSLSNCNVISITGLNPTCPVSWCDISNCYLSHKQCSSLCKFISHTKCLNDLKLSNIKCSKDTCAGHDIDITNHNQLKKLSVYTCNMISITGINPTCPIWKCTIGNCNMSHKQCTSLCTFLSHAEVLNNLKLSEIKCTEDACAGHEIDITNHKQLKVLSLSHCIYTIYITGINPACSILTCTISNCYRSHEQCAWLRTYISHAKSLKYLTLSEIKCTKDACACHEIDITNHKQLKELSLSNCSFTISITGMNPACSILGCTISNCYLSHEQCTSLCTCLSNAKYLNKLTLSEIKCTKDACAGHEINITNHRQLKELSLSNCNMIPGTGINPRSCIIKHSSLSHEQCTSLCTSLSQAEYLKYLSLNEINCTKDACEGHDVDLTNDKQLKKLSISNCNRLSITGILPNCSITEYSMSNCKLSHEQCTSLCTFISKVITLQVLDLCAITCTKDRCEGHYIDLSNHKYLDEPIISDCNAISVSKDI